MRRLSLLALLLAACEGPSIQETEDTDPNGDGDTDSDTLPPVTDCTATVASTDPRDGHGSFPVSLPVTARFSSAVGAGQWSLGVDGVSGSASLATDGLSATFTPDAPLANSTAYTLRASACGAEITSAFTTAGAPLAEEALSGRTYVIDYDEVQWVAPAGAALVSGQIPVEYLLLHVVDADTVADTIEVVGSLGETSGSDVVQDQCTEPFSFGVQDFSTNPVFRVGPTRLVFPANGQEIAIEAAFVEATFVEAGAALVDLTISGQLDTRPLDSVSFTGDACTDLGFLGVSCGACASDGAAECIDVVLQVDRAEVDASLVFDPALVPGQGC